MTKSINLKQLSKSLIGTTNTAIDAIDTTLEVTKSFLDRQRDKSKAVKETWELQGRKNYVAELHRDLAADHKAIVESIVEAGLEESVTALQRGESLSFEFSK